MTPERTNELTDTFGKILGVVGGILLVLIPIVVAALVVNNLH